MPVSTGTGEKNTHLTLLSTICPLTRLNSIPSNEFGSSPAVSVSTTDTSHRSTRSSTPSKNSSSHGHAQTKPYADYAHLLKSLCLGALGGKGRGFSRFPPLAVGQGESQQPTDSSHFQPQG